MTTTQVYRRGCGFDDVEATKAEWECLFAPLVDTMEPLSDAQHEMIVHTAWELPVNQRLHFGKKMKI